MAINEVCFMADIDPLGYHTYFVSFSVNYMNLFTNLFTGYSNSISNGLIRLVFDAEGYLSQLQDLTTGKKYLLQQKFFYYWGAGWKNANWDYPPSECLISPKKLLLRQIRASDEEFSAEMVSYLSRIIVKIGSMSVIAMIDTASDVKFEAKE
uniref:Uncharacterized protein n=1 Tax=Acrobeloides nanus TaxID=290746 RepID=A0A914EJ21_9BILA